MTAVGYFEDPRPDIQALVSVRHRRVLDVGCGAGALGESFLQAGATEVVGLEGNAGAAATARKKLSHVVECDLAVADFDLEGTFDVIVMADVLEHLPEPDLTLRKVLSYLAADGTVIVSVPNFRFWSVLLRLLVNRWELSDSGIRDRTHLRIFTDRTLRELLVSEGLRIERLVRKYRLLEDQSQIGRFGAALTHAVRLVVGPLLFRNLLAYQYLAVARLATSSSDAR